LPNFAEPNRHIFAFLHQILALQRSHTETIAGDALIRTSTIKGKALFGTGCI
jgi:hypothetical protein